MFLVIENSEPMYTNTSPFSYNNAIAFPDASNRIHLSPSTDGNINLQAYLRIYYKDSITWNRSVRISNILRFTLRAKPLISQHGILLIL